MAPVNTARRMLGKSQGEICPESTPHSRIEPFGMTSLIYSQIVTILETGPVGARLMQAAKLEVHHVFLIVLRI